MRGNKIVLDLEFTPIRDADLQAIASSEILEIGAVKLNEQNDCLLYTSPSPRDPKTSRMPSSA